VDDALKNLLRGLGGAAVEAGVKHLDSRAAKAKEAKAAKPEGKPSGSLTPRQVYGFSADDKLDIDKIRRRYHELARVYHPDLDAGRSDSAMFVVLGKIRDKLLKELK
jgi:hypothetical protein